MKDDAWGWLKDYKSPAIAAPSVATKIRKRREHFVMLPMTWYERMRGADGQTYRVVWYLLYLHWKGNGEFDQASQRHAGNGRRAATD